MEEKILRMPKPGNYSGHFIDWANPPLLVLQFTNTPFCKRIALPMFMEPVATLEGEEIVVREEE